MINSMSCQIRQRSQWSCIHNVNRDGWKYRKKYISPYYNMQVIKTKSTRIKTDPTSLPIKRGIELRMVIVPAPHGGSSCAVVMLLTLRECHAQGNENRKGLIQCKHILCYLGNKNSVANEPINGTPNCHKLTFSILHPQMEYT